MDTQIITEQIVENSVYVLFLQTQGTSLTIKLNIKVSQRKTDVYQIILNSVKDIQKLQENFQTLEDFKQHIKDVSNFEVVLQDKVIRILGKLENKKIKKVIQIASIPLQFLNSVEKDPEEDLVEKILQSCNSKNQMSGEQVKVILKNIAICFSENIKQKKQNRKIKEEQEETIKKLRIQLEANQEVCVQRHIRKEQSYQNQINNLTQTIKKLEEVFEIKIKDAVKQAQRKWQENKILSQSNLKEKFQKREQEYKKEQIQTKKRQIKLEENLARLNEKIKKIQVEVDKQIINYPESDWRLRYQGQVKDGKREGKGILYYKNNDKYEGEFKNDKRDGKGIIYYNDGEKYQGEWKEGRYDGKGIYHSVDGSRQFGKWKNGELVGKTTVYYKYGAIQIRAYKNMESIMIEKIYPSQ